MRRIQDVYILSPGCGAFADWFVYTVVLVDNRDMGQD